MRKISKVVILIIVLILFISNYSYADTQDFLNEKIVRASFKKELETYVPQWLEYIGNQNLEELNVESLKKLRELNGAYIEASTKWTMFTTYKGSYPEKYEELESVGRKLQSLITTKENQNQYLPPVNGETPDPGTDITENINTTQVTEIADDRFVIKRTYIYQFENGEYKQSTTLLNWGDKVYVYYKQSDGWCQITSPETGFVKAEYLAISEPESKTEIVDFPDSGVIIGMQTGSIEDPTTQDGANKYNPNSEANLTEANSSKLLSIGKNIIGVVNVIATVVAVLVLTLLGIKYMMGSTEEKAEYKETMIPYIVGTIFIFSTTTIVNLIYNFAISFNN